MVLIVALTILVGTATALGITKSGAFAEPASQRRAEVPLGATPTTEPAAQYASPASETTIVTATPTPTLTAGPGASEASDETIPSTPTSAKATKATAKKPAPKKYGRFLRPLSTNPYDGPSQELRTQRTTASATTLRLLKRIAGNPIADWYGGSTQSVKQSVAYRVKAAAHQKAVAQLVVYNLPNRDCEGGYSASTLSAAQYRTWFRTFVAGLGTHKAIVILEPDALMQVSCLTTAQRMERYGLLSWATALLHTQGSWTYIDAGHSAGVSVTTTAARLQQAGVAKAAGFSLNVSGFRSNAESINFGTAISKKVGGKHFLIDSSRNGVAPKNADWCNPSGKGLGHRPTAKTGVALLDTYLWVKTPGSSDGSCNGGPPSGAWWQSSALMLARNAHLG